jgi:nucleoside-diphosphate-sugar epimerase
MKILITGATGFLGKSLCSYLAGDHEIFALHRENAITIPGVEMLEHDLSKPIARSQLPGKIDAVVHLAQSLRYKDFPSGLSEVHEINVRSTMELLDYARMSGAQKFLFASTGSVYEGMAAPQLESQGICPRSLYARSKYSAELLCECYEQIRSVALLRLVFLSGPGQAGMLLPNIIEKIEHGRAIMLGDSEDGMLFCPTYVDDVARVFVSALGSEVYGKFNVANPETISLREAALLIGERLGKKVIFDRDETHVDGVFKPSVEALNKWYDLTNQFRNFSVGIIDTLGQKLPQ